MPSKRGNLDSLLGSHCGDLQDSPPWDFPVLNSQDTSQYPFANSSILVYCAVSDVFKDLFLFYVHKWFPYTCVYVLCACLVPAETRRGYWIPGDLSYTGLWAELWMLGMELISSAGAASALNCWVISPASSNYISWEKEGLWRDMLFHLGQNRSQHFK